MLCRGALSVEGLRRESRSPQWCGWWPATASSASSRFRRERPSTSASRPPTGTRSATPVNNPDPDRFDPNRTNIAHLTFGGGPHLCPAMHLARIEAAVAINALLDRLPDLRLDPSASVPHVVGVAFRSPTPLPVEFNPAHT